MTALRPEMLDAPPEMKGRPVDHRGFYVPWFVTRKDDRGLWDFQNVDVNRVAQAVKEERCFVSGAPLGKFMSFVVGPMCCINRISAEPGCKKAIAEWSVKVCPFLTNPKAKRPDMEGPKDQVTPGIMVPDNPGTEFIWTCLRKDVRIDRQSHLFRLGEPTSIQAFTQKREATEDEIKAVMETGFGKLLKICEDHGEMEFVDQIYAQDRVAQETFIKLGVISS